MEQRNANCTFCGESLPRSVSGKVPGYAYCGLRCRKAHRRQRLVAAIFPLFLTGGLLSLAAAAVVIDRQQKTAMTVAIPPLPRKGLQIGPYERVVSARLLRVEGERVFLLLDGREIDYPFSHFSDEDRAKIRAFLKTVR